MKTRFARFVGAAVIVGVLCSMVEDASALTYVKLIPEPGFGNSGSVLGVPMGHATSPSPAEMARLQKIRLYNASANRANYYMQQIEQTQTYLFQSRNYYMGQYNATGNPQFQSAYQNDYNVGMQRIAQFSRLRNQELSYLSNLSRQ